MINIYYALYRKQSQAIYSSKAPVLYLGKLVFQYFLWRPNISEEGIEEISRGLRVYLLFTEVNV